MLGSVTFKAAKAPVDLRLDPTGSYLYVVDAGAKAMPRLFRQSRHLSELHGSPFPVSGDAPFGIITD